MKNKFNAQRIGFDFDKVFVNYPPFIPGSLIEYLYKRRNHNLSYRFPGKLEQKIRILSHIPFFRPPIKENIESLKKIYEKNDSRIYLVSSRFSFLKDRTELWDRVNNIFRYFEEIYFNFADEQPHIFKNRIIKKARIEKFIDDDLDLLLYLSERNTKVKFYWINKKGIKKLLPKNIVRIKNLEEFLNKYA